jgi:hypothetical protein
MEVLYFAACGSNVLMMRRFPSIKEDRLIGTGGSAKDAPVNGLSSEPSSHPRWVDFDIHGLIGIRLVDPSPGDIEAVSKQLGALQKPLLRKPDILLRFVEHLPTPQLRHLGLRQMGFTHDAFVVFEEGGNGARVRIPFDQVGGECELVCESGLRSVPLLMPILGLTALAKGFVAVHASAFTHNGVGVLMAGWSESGKTTTLLGYASRGAEFVGEEWVLLSGDGQTMYGLPRMIELSVSHLEAHPHLRRSIKRWRLWFFEGLRRLKRAHDAIPRGKASRTAIGAALRKILTALEQRVLPGVTPQAIFGSRVGSLAAKPEKLFLLVSHDDTSVRVESTPTCEMARRLAHLAQYEQMRFMEHYVAFKFAFPDRENALVEHSSACQLDILRRALLGKDTYTVWHPYPPVFSALYEKMQPLMDQGERPELKLEALIPEAQPAASE